MKGSQNTMLASPIRSMPRVGPLLAALALTTACTGRPSASLADPAGVLTTIDSTADTVVARVTGPIPDSLVRRLVAETTIEPAAEDTSLFTETFDVEVDRAGRFWVFDSPTNSIFLFDRAGALIRRIGRVGGGPGEFRSNNGMVPAGDSGVAIWDSQNARIAFFDGAGIFTTSWPTPAGFSTNEGLQQDRLGTLYLRRPVTPPREGEILGRMGLVRLTATGGLADSLIPLDLDVPRETYLAVHKSKAGNSQSSTGARYAPGYHWAWHPDGYFVVGHGGRFELTLLPKGRKPLVIRRDFPPVPVPAEERADEQARITYGMRQTDPSWAWNGPALPESKAPLLGITVTRDGRIWTQVATPSVRIPDDEIPSPRDPKAPVTRYRTPTVFEVFEPSGRFLGRVDCRCRITLVDAEGDRVWAIVRGESDLPAVVRFRIDPPLR